LSYGGPQRLQKRTLSARLTVERIRSPAGVRSVNGTPPGSDMRKTAFAAGLAAGYVLGTRAGRQRYETIARTAQRIRSSQTVQSAAGVVRQQAGTAAESALRRVPGSDRVLHRLPLRDHSEAS